jgi:hypothetical protein
MRAAFNSDHVLSEEISDLHGVNYPDFAEGGFCGRSNDSQKPFSIRAVNNLTGLKKRSRCYPSAVHRSKMQSRPLFSREPKMPLELHPSRSPLRERQRFFLHHT